MALHSLYCAYIVLVCR